VVEQDVRSKLMADPLKNLADVENLAKSDDGSILKPGALLHTMRWANVKKKPLIMEFAVPETDPFLVTSSRALMWIPKARNARVRAAVRPIESTAHLFMDIVRESTHQGRKAEWGNTHPLTADGIKAAIEHVKFYDLTDLCILANPDIDWAAINPEWVVQEENVLSVLFQLPVESAPWLDPRYVLVVPRDRGFIGFVIEIGDGYAVSVIHNASRGIGIATSASEPEPDANEPVA
jgi:hypothetical protein